MSLGPLVAGLFAGTDAVSVVGRLNKPLQLEKPPPPPPTARKYRHLVNSTGNNGITRDRKHSGVTSKLAAIHDAVTLNVKSRKRRRAESEARAMAMKETSASLIEKEKKVTEEIDQNKKKQELDEQQQQSKHRRIAANTLPTTSSFSSIVKSSGSTAPAQGSLLALAQALVGGAIRPQATLPVSNNPSKQVVSKETTTSKPTESKQQTSSLSSSAFVSSSALKLSDETCQSLPTSSKSNAETPHGGERMRKLRRDIHGWNIVSPGNSQPFHEAYSQWWTNAYAETVKASVSSGSQPSKVSGGGGNVSLADINAAIKERKREEEMKKKGLSLDVNQKAKQVKLENKAIAVPTSLTSAALVRAVHLTLIKSLNMKGAWAEVTRCKEHVPLQMPLSSVTSSVLANTADNDLQQSLNNHFSGFITWIGSDYFTIVSPFPQSLRRITLRKKGTMLCIRWPSFALKKGEKFVPNPPGPIETLIECKAEDLSPSE